MRSVFVLIIVFVCLMLQIPALTLLGLQNFSVDVTLVATIFLASSTSGVAPLLVVSLMGLLTDTFMPGGLFGMQMEIQVVMFVLARMAMSRFQLSRTIPLMLVVFASSVLSALLFLLFSVVFDRGYSYTTQVVTSGLTQAVMTAVFAPLLFKLFGIADGRFHRKRDARSLFV